MILGERERILGQANEAGSGTMSGQGQGGEDGGDAGVFGGAGPGGLPGGIIVASSPDGTSGAGHMPSGGAARQGEYSGQAQPAYPVPGDIPSGNDDDVVARQLREAAMNEPDPELREKLWDEYRQYTGLAKQ
jgi:hypothetical protein